MLLAPAAHACPAAAIIHPRQLRGRRFALPPPLPPHASPADTYLGHRGPDELQTVTGNRLWEWVSFGRWGGPHGGYDVKQQKFLGESWPEELGEPLLLGAAGRCLCGARRWRHRQLPAFTDACMPPGEPPTSVAAPHKPTAACCRAGEEFKATSLSFQRQVHEVSVKILKALFVGLGRDPAEIDDVSAGTEAQALHCAVVLTRLLPQPSTTGRSLPACLLLCSSAAAL